MRAQPTVDGELVNGFLLIIPNQLLRSLGPKVTVSLHCALAGLGICLAHVWGVGALIWVGFEVAVVSRYGGSLECYKLHGGCTHNQGSDRTALLYIIRVLAITSSGAWSMLYT